MEKRLVELERLLDWYSSYADYVEHNFRNINNEAIDYANKCQE